MRNHTKIADGWRRLGWLLHGLLASAVLLGPASLWAESIAVRHVAGTLHGFLVLRTAEGETLAAGDLVQVVRGNRLETRLSLHFKDGSLDDETTVFSQHGMFQLVSNHHIQKGPSFPHSLDMQIDAETGIVTTRSSDDGNEKIRTEHFDLPPELANGLIPTVLSNLPAALVTTSIPLIVAAPKPRLAAIAISRNGSGTFWTGGAPHTAARYDLKIRLGGLAGALAPVIGKEPADIHVWILEGPAPVLVRMEGQFYAGGPIWLLELASPTWSLRPAPAGT